MAYQITVTFPRNLCPLFSNLHHVMYIAHAHTYCIYCILVGFTFCSKAGMVVIITGRLKLLNFRNIDKTKYKSEDGYI